MLVVVPKPQPQPVVVAHPTPAVPAHLPPRLPAPQCAAVAHCTAYDDNACTCKTCAADYKLESGACTACSDGRSRMADGSCATVGAAELGGVGTGRGALLAGARPHTGWPVATRLASLVPATAALKPRRLGR